MLEREEFRLLKEKGRVFADPFEAVSVFESTIANYMGAPYGVAVDCCTHAIELSLRYLKADGGIEVPRRTYPSVPMTVLKVGCEILWTDHPWEKSYKLEPFPVIDASLAFEAGSYVPGTFTCLSFQQKKTLPIGRGGMILTSDAQAAEWLRCASYDGRHRGVLWKDDRIETLGYHYYMTPEDAARGLLLFEDLHKLQMKSGGCKDYPDISQFEVFRRHGI